MKRLAQVIVFVGFVNFLAFVVGTFIVGGDAINGHSLCPAGKHYLYDKLRDEPCHEVSAATYRYSKLHSYFTFISFPLAMAGGVLLNRLRKRSTISQMVR
ncbi:MAG: hypothetical protein DMD38_15840 [Gemmatimonadetes bacterium]|nr:MAG: hypothetical protein DMD38_15840 [Gemmatimonadota bacterium]